MAMQQLVPTFSGTLSGISQPLVNARDLHANLCVQTLFKDWIVRRIETYGFTEGEDYCSNLSSGENQGLRRFVPGANRKDYHVSLEMAKELALLENNAVGRQIRRQLIALERDVPAQLRTLEAQLDAARLEALSTRPQWQQILRYLSLGLSQTEIGKLTGLSADAVRDHLKRMAALGLTDWRVNPRLSALGKRGHAKLLALKGGAA